MAKGCCAKCSKFILVTINLVLFLLGVAVLVFGVIFLVDADTVLDALDKVDINLRDILNSTGLDVISTLKWSAVYLVVLGGVVAIVGLFGCCGACCENGCLLGLYITVLIIVLLSEVAVVVIAIVLPHKLKETVGGKMFDTLNAHFHFDLHFDGTKVNLSSDPIERAWATIHFELACCGAHNYTDFKALTPVWRQTYTYTVDGQQIVQDSVIPASCCNVKEKKIEGRLREVSDFVNLEGCLKDDSDVVTSVNNQGCYDAILEFLELYLHVVIGVAAGIAAIEVLLVIMAASVCCGRKRRDKSV